MDIAAYCRVSTDKSDQLNSLQAQKQFFTEYAARCGHRLVRLYADEGLSGTKIKNRRAFQQLLHDAPEGLFEMLVVKDISRFARNTVDLLQSIRQLKALGIETLFLTANMSVLGQSEFVLTIFGALAQEESANTSKRVKFGKRLNAEKGRVPNLVYGYDKTCGDYFHLRINPQEAEVVRQIFSWYTEEGYGAYSIAALLNARGLVTKRGCAWSQNSVCRILKNELYAGRLVNGKQEVADFLTGRRRDCAPDEWLRMERPELQLISPAQFDAAQQLLQSRSQAFRAQRQRQSNRHLFSTLIRCGSCGWSFRRMVRTYRNTYVRWGCSARNGRGAESCPNTVTVDETALLDALDSYFADCMTLAGTSPAALLRAFRQLLRNTGEAQPQPAQLQKLRSARQRCLQLYAESLMDHDELTAQLQRLQEQLDTLEAARSRAAQAQRLQDLLPRVLHARFNSASQIIKTELLSNAQLRRLLAGIEVHSDGRVEIYLQPLGETKPPLL